MLNFNLLLYKKKKKKKVAGGSMEGMEGLNVFKRRIHKILQPLYKSINVGQWEVKGWIYWGQYIPVGGMVLNSCFPTYF